MNVIDTAIPDVKIIEPKVFGDARGFYESFNARAFAEGTGVNVQFVQDNHSKAPAMYCVVCITNCSRLRGKLVRVVQGEVWDVAVDIRRSSPTLASGLG